MPRVTTNLKSRPYALKARPFPVQEMEDNRAHLIVTLTAVQCKGVAPPSYSMTQRKGLGLRGLGFRGLGSLGFRF